MYLSKHPRSWKKSARKKIDLKRWLFSPPGIVAFLLGAVFCLWLVSSGAQDQPGDVSKKEPPKEKPSPSRPIDKAHVRSLLKKKNLLNLKEPEFQIEGENMKLLVETGINQELQQAVLVNLDRKNSRSIGFIAMDPFTGRIISMVGFDKEDPNNNPCLMDRFPAASVFKIVTAAAAMEKCGLTSDSLLKYTGAKHTLYKGQLKKRTKRKQEEVTLKDSFAKSVNPVFGKLGLHRLGKVSLCEYADAFGFNQKINFEAPLVESSLKITDTPYNWAEVASGFNRETVISPLHGALIASAILNKGLMPEPALVDRITDHTGAVIYGGKMTLMNRAVTKKTSEMITQMMAETVASGTCRKAFKNSRKDPVLGELLMGGKTGSINNGGDNIRYDWFVGFAADKKGPEKLAVSVLVAHEDYIGRKAVEYARLAFKTYFKDFVIKRNSK